MNIKKTFGKKIKRLRKAKNLTQEQLAEMIDIAPKNLSKIEVGTCFVSAETLENLIVALDTTTEEIFANDHIKLPNELLAEIYKNLNKINNNQEKLELIYKIIDFIVKN
ncbi:helix-turn-helix transcriptional regulator [bacterium]|nr:helix-turn-helix transcriptional regulator [bacterium]